MTVHTIIEGEELVKAFAIALWREVDAGVSYADVYSGVARQHLATEWMDVDDVVELFGYDVLRHIKTVERAVC